MPAPGRSLSSRPFLRSCAIRLPLPRARGCGRSPSTPPTSMTGRRSSVISLQALSMSCSSAPNGSQAPASSKKSSTHSLGASVCSSSTRPTASHRGGTTFGPTTSGSPLSCSRTRHCPSSPRPPPPTHGSPQTSRINSARARSSSAVSSPAPRCGSPCSRGSRPSNVTHGSQMRWGSSKARGSSTCLPLQRRRGSRGSSHHAASQSRSTQGSSIPRSADGSRMRCGAMS